ncbi:MAG: hypothetical protein ACK4I8_05765 [Armatimonadota bacterium]
MASRQVRMSADWQIGRLVIGELAIDELVIGELTIVETCFSRPSSQSFKRPLP